MKGSRWVVVVALASGCATGDETDDRLTIGASIGPVDSGGTTAAAASSDGAASTSGETSTGVGTGVGDDSTGPGTTTSPVASTGAPVPGTYPPCEGGVCEDGSCVAFEDGAFCGPDCVDSTTCPPPPEGDAVPQCRSFDDLTSCVLECSGGQTCPTGMLCDLVVGQGAFCVWP